MSEDLTPQPSPEPTPLGSALAAARKQRGLSIEDVAAATRVRAGMIREIEHDDFGHCGGAIYARGHIKAIANVVGADADALVSEFDRRNGDSLVPRLRTSPLPTFEPSSDVTRVRRRAPHWASAAIAVLTVLAVFLGVNWLRDDSSGTGAARDVPPTVEDSASPTPSAATATPAPSPSATTPKPPPGVSLRVQVAEEPSWLRVQSSTGSELFAGILDAGQSMEWRDPRLLTVKFGNAPAVRLTVNGRGSGPPCDRNVCTVEFPASSAAG